jgi:hypothetical protein
MPAAAGVMGSMNPGAARGMRSGMMMSEYMREQQEMRRLQELFQQSPTQDKPASVYDANEPPTSEDRNEIGSARSIAMQLGAGGDPRNTRTAMSALVRLSDIEARDARMSRPPQDPYRFYEWGKGNQVTGEQTYSPYYEEEARLGNTLTQEKTETEQARQRRFDAQTQSDRAQAEQRGTAADVNRAKIKQIEAEVSRREAEPYKYNINELINWRKSVVAQLEEAEGEEGTILALLNRIDNLIASRVKSVPNPDDDSTGEAIPNPDAEAEAEAYLKKLRGR